MRGVILAGLLAATPALADTPAPSGPARQGGDKAPPQSVWVIETGGEGRHLQSGLRCASDVGGFARTPLTVFDGFGLDVACGYDGRGVAITQYFSRGFALDQAYDQAKAAVAQNSRLLQEKLAEKNKLLSQLEQARMQEEMNSAMAQLNETVGDDVPTLKEVQEKIEARYAKAKATAELGETSVQSRILEVEQATANIEAQSRLSQLRAELGLDSAAAPAAVEQPKPAEG